MTYDVTVERPGGTDRFGNPLDPATHTEPNCWAAPAGSTEQTHLEDVVDWDLDLFVLGPDADIRYQDVVYGIPGHVDSVGKPIRYQVTGRPAVWRSPTGWNPGTVARLKGVS